MARRRENAMQPPVTADLHSWVLDPSRLRAELDLIGFRADLMDLLAEGATSAARLSGSEVLIRSILDECLNGSRRKPEIPGYPWLPALAVISRFPHARALYRSRGVPFSIVRATLCDMERSFDAFAEEHGRPGFNNVRWMRHHLSARLFEIGRLQYQPARLGLPYVIYRRKSDGTCVAFARGGVVCTEDGWPVTGTADFETSLSMGENRIRGHLVAPEDGRISRLATEILLSEYDVAADWRSDVLHVHIPSGDRLSDRACGDSVQQAAALIPGYFPEAGFKGFACVSWLLDSQLQAMLPQNSNILNFGRRFFRLALPDADGDQILERVLGRGSNPGAAVARNSLQAAVLRHLEAGAVFRTTGGFIPWNPSGG